MATKVTPLAEMTISTAGTAQQIIVTSTECSSVFVSADRLNTGKIYVGLTDVDENKFIAHLKPGEALTMDAPVIRGTTEALFVNDYWIDTETNGNTAHISYQHRRK